MKLLKGIVCVLVVLTLTACGSKDINDTDDTNNNPSMNIDIVNNNDGSSYSVENGSTQYLFTVEDGETVELELIFDNQKGSIDVYVAKDGVEANADFREKDLSSGTYNVTVSEAGSYQVLYTCKDYVGEYSCSIEKK